jgi:hypothetical protein
MHLDSLLRGYLSVYGAGLVPDSGNRTRRI